MFLKQGLRLVLSGLLYSCASFRSVDPPGLSDIPALKPAQFFYQSQGGNVEAYLVRPEGKGPFPLAVLLHGHNVLRAGAKMYIAAGELFSRELCYASLAISLPGYGATEVEGATREATLGAVSDGISEVGKLPWIDRERVVLYGFSRGALFAAALAGRVTGLRAVILHSGAYDTRKLYEETSSDWLRRTLNPNGESNPPLFTILPEVSRWIAPALIMHGARDRLVPAAQALALRDRLRALGKPHRLVIFPDAGHWLPLKAAKEAVFSFLAEQVGSAC